MYFLRSYTADQLPELAETLQNTTNVEQIKKCCAAAAQIAQELVLPDGTNPVDGVEPLLEEDLLVALMNVVRNCATMHKVAVRNAIRALADISKMDAAKPALFDHNIFDVLKPYFEATADNGRQTSKKEVFSFAACTLVSNMLAEETVKQMIELDYTNLFNRLLKSSIASRPAASAFAAAILKQFTALPAGFDAIQKSNTLTAIKATLETAVAILPNATDNKEDILSVIRFCAYLVNSCLQNNPETINDVIRLEFPTVLGDCFIATNTPEGQTPDFSTLQPHTVPILDILLALIGTEDGEPQVTENITIVPLYYMLLRLSQGEPGPDAAQQLSKLSLAIGGCFTGEEGDEVEAQQIISLLNTLSRTFVEGDSEVVFIVTSLIVHLANFATGTEGIRTPDSFVTRATVLKYFCEQEKTEVAQSILRNECAILNQAYPADDSDPEMIEMVSANGIYSLLNQLLGMYTELNSEIIETILLFLSRVAQVPEGVAHLKKQGSVLRTVVDYFSTTNKDDERADSIVQAGQIIINLL